MTVEVTKGTVSTAGKWCACLPPCFFLCFSTVFRRYRTKIDDKLRSRYERGKRGERVKGREDERCEDAKLCCEGGKVEIAPVVFTLNMATKATKRGDS